MSGNSREIVFYRRINTQNPKIKQPPIWEIFEGKTVMPNNYEPDLDDKHFRDARIPEHCFHELARGSQAIVIAASLVRKIGEKDESREKVAAKRFNIAELKQNAKSEEYQGFTFLLRELQNTQYLVHPNIVEMRDSFYESSEDPANGRLSYVWLVTERMDCSLEFYFELLSRKDNDARGPSLRDHRHLASLLVQLLKALDFLHSRGIMHRDVTPKNIGLNRKDFVVKLLDFGISGQTNSQRDHTKLVSTPLIYQPLESHLVDVWAVGLIAFGMLGTKLMYPTDMKREDKVKQRILDVVGLPLNKYEDIFGESLLNEDCRLSTLDEEFKRAFSRLKNDSEEHPLNPLTRGNLRDLLEKLLSVNPQKRMKPSICLNHSYLQELNVCF
ncbi:unnamed protein product, partial [Mesorhabditis belari]|uniref:Protein kinase domain-containing protein n=1 Tax=Mesorhabditis belari TaxID=2138241 RepID=A0AAF3F956_9BILA